MVEYLSGERIQGTSTLTSSPPQTSWKEIGRTTLGSAGDTIDVTGFAVKDNLMILNHAISSGVVQWELGLGSAGSIDTGNNYATRIQRNGQELTRTSQNTIESEQDLAQDQFVVLNLTNVSAQEKLCVGDVMLAGASGAGNAPNRCEIAGKWANTSAQINSARIGNAGGGDIASGSEVVILGCDDDEADSGTNFWQELSSTVLTATHSGALTVPQFTTKKYLMISYYINASTDCQWRVGTGGSIDSGNNYHNRYSSNGAGDSTLQYTSFLQHNPIVQGEVFIINKSDKEKLIIQHEVGQNQGSGAGGSGAGNISNRQELVGKWANTSGQIDTLQYTKSGVSFYAGTTIKVYGAD